MHCDLLSNKHITVLERLVVISPKTSSAYIRLGRPRIRRLSLSRISAKGPPATHDSGGMSLLVPMGEVRNDSRASSPLRL